MFTDPDGGCLFPENGCLCAKRIEARWVASTRELTFPEFGDTGIYDITNAPDGTIPQALKSIRNLVADRRLALARQAAITTISAVEMSIALAPITVNAAGNGHDFVDARGGADTVNGSGTDNLYGGVQTQPPIPMTT